MRGYFTYSGADSRDYGVYISGFNTYNAPARAFERISIPGRDGDILMDSGRYEMIAHAYDAFIVKNMNTNLEALRNYLMQFKSYQKLMDSYHPDEYYMAYYNAGLESDIGILHHTAEFKLNFMRKPQRFLISGDEVTTLTANGSITNPTMYESKPLLRVYGTGTLGIGSQSIRIIASDVYTDIDCEMQDAYKGLVNCNGNVEFSNQRFPTIPAGEVGISLSGITKVEITPRWYRL